MSTSLVSLPDLKRLDILHKVLTQKGITCDEIGHNILLEKYTFRAHCSENTLRKLWKEHENEEQKLVAKKRKVDTEIEEKERVPVSQATDLPKEPERVERYQKHVLVKYKDQDLINKARQKLIESGITCEEAEQYGIGQHKCWEVEAYCSQDTITKIFSQHR